MCRAVPPNPHSWPPTTMTRRFFTAIDSAPHFSRLPCAVLVGLLSVIGCSTTLADLPSEEDFFAELPMTSATRLAQAPHDLPVSVTVIDRDMLEAMGATELADVFRIVAGFKVGRVSGGMYSVSGHGIGDHFSRRLMVLIDGRPVQYPMLKMVDWNALPIEIDDIDSIEVMRGTSAAVYGSNAFDGAINIVTYKPFENRGSRVQLLTGEPGVVSGLFRHGFSAYGGEHSLTISDKRADGLDGRHDGHHFTKLRYRGSFSPTVNDELDVQIGLSHGYLEQDSEGRDRRRDTDIDYQYLNWRHHYDDGDDFSLKLYRNQTAYDDPVVTLGIPTSQPFLFKSVSHRYGIDAERSFHFDDLRFVVGATVHSDDNENDTVGDRSNTERQLFSSMEWQPNNSVTLNAGMMLEDTKSTAPTLSPRLSFNYHLDSNNTIRLSAARSLRASAARSFGSKTANDTPEQVTSYEIGHLLTLRTKGLSLDTKLYRDAYKDIPVVIRDAQNKPRASIGEFTATGLDLQLKYAPDSDSLIALQYSYAQIADQALISPQPDPATDAYGQVMPENMLAVLLSKKLPDDWQLSMTYAYVGEMEWKGWGDLVGSYQRLDARIAKDFRLGSNWGKLEIIGHNLTNTFTDFQDGNIMDRRLLVRVGFTY